MLSLAGALTSVRGAAVVVLMAICLLGLSAPSALAEGGNGLYEPFPTSVGPRAERFLRGAVSPSALKRGQFLTPRGRPGANLVSGSSTGPSGRAGVGGSLSLFGPLLVLAALGAGGATVAARRRVRPSSPRAG